MQTKELRILVYEYSGLDDLPEADQKLILSAREASEKAYAPYSRFRVGAAIRLADGTIVLGNNQENAASPVGLCAERVALFSANAGHSETAVEAVAVTAFAETGLVEQPVKPCGSCRQALMEAEVRFGQPIRIILDGKQKIQVFDGIESLLPFAFKPESLG